MAAKPEMAVFDSYVAAIENGVGSDLFRNLYCHVDGELVDILKSGLRSCASFVSSILYLYKLIEDRHATVDGTIVDMERSGWRRIPEPKRGAVILWDFEQDPPMGEDSRRHIGFYVNEVKAVSTNKLGRVTAHHPHGNEDARRAVLAYYWHDTLN